MNNIKIVEPFLRWAGGKVWFTKELQGLLPNDANNYYEPFIGGGSVYFNVCERFKASVISDLNFDLIETYKCVRDNPKGAIDILKTYRNEETFYYKIRESKPINACELAAKFIFLNRTSFNGIYRVNQKGIYNVPFGRRKIADLVREDQLLLCSKKLQDTIIVCQDFYETIKNSKKGDLVFVDPPYTVAHENNGFILYNQKLFSLDDQCRLAQSLKYMNNKNVNFIMTNAFHEAIGDIYKDVGEFRVLERTSLIGGTGSQRGNIKEYIVKNF
jgi:DNA adenine methylase